MLSIYFSSANISYSWPKSFCFLYDSLTNHERTNQSNAEPGSQPEVLSWKLLSLDRILDCKKTASSPESLQVNSSKPELRGVKWREVIQLVDAKKEILFFFSFLLKEAPVYQLTDFSGSFCIIGCSVNYIKILWDDCAIYMKTGSQRQH